jgi:hypothetical protein
MPRIPDILLDTVIYLYPTAMDAEGGARVGGTGFLVSVPASTAGVPAALYAVTNSHIIREAKSPVVRLNTQQGGKEVIPLTCDQWHHHSDGDDIAVCPIGLESDHHRFFALDSTGWFLAKEELDADSIGPGDEVFFLGRYINHEGQQRNLPTVRFGTISMLPYEPIEHPRGTLVDSFLVEARSLSGYSGSPVFLFIMPYTFRDMEWNDNTAGPNRARETRQARLSLLGIDWGHNKDFKPVLESDKETPLPERWWVEQNSGIMNVAPAWKLTELLDEPELVDMRRRLENDWVAGQI